MDGQDYLNQISAKNRPVKSSGRLSGILKSKFFWVGTIGIGLTLLVVIIGSALTGGKSSEQDLSIALKLHLDNTSAVIKEYQKFVKSSSLRSSSASLDGALTFTSTKLNEYLVSKYQYNGKSIKKNIETEANTAKDALASNLFEAKINGVLDRTFASKMAYEISMIAAEEVKIINTTKNEALKELLGSSRDSLENLYPSFNDFSESQ